MQALHSWQPKVVKWCHEIDSGGSNRDQAIQAVKGISDPAALDALAAGVAGGHRIEKFTEANRLLIEAIGRVQGADATQVLLRCALFSKLPDMRTAAALELKKRPLYAFVPTLLQMLNGPTTTRFEIYILPDGTVIHDHAVLRLDPYEHAYTEFVSVGPSVHPTAWNTAIKVQRAQREAVQIERQAALRIERNQRIQDVLAQATDFNITGDPGLLFQQWTSFADTYAPPVAAAPLQQQFFGVVRYLSCFPAGTPVVTMSGSTSIEKIKIGDRLLAQNPQTGELAFKAVQGVTLRPPAPMIAIGTGPHTLLATRGHPFWVNGQGWQMAKQLKVGAVLHSLNGAVLVDRLEEAPAREAYNLVVSDFDTYFVGDERILVHDNLPLQETTALVPGFTEQAGPQP